MKRLLFMALLGVSALAGARDETKCYFGFFTQREKPTVGENFDVQAAQAAHLKNLTDVMLNKGGLAAGPLNDPTKIRRGIVCFQATSVEEGLKNFVNDPFVTNKIMAVELFEWKVNPKLFNVKAADPKALTEYMLAVITPGPSKQPVNDKILGEHKSYIAGLYKSSAMRAHGEISGPTKMKEVAIFETKDADAVKEALAEDPLVKRQLLEVEVLPLWMSKGIFGS